MRPFNSANWRFAPYNRSSFQDVQSLFPTVRTKRGEGPPMELPISTRDIRDVEFPGATGSTGTISQLLDAPESDAFLVLKDGVLLSEHYGNGMARDSLHLVNSVSKSFLGMLAGILCDEGVVDVDRPVTAYLPELNRNAFPRTTVRHLLDMTAAVQFGEDYDNQSDDFWVEASIVGWRPELQGLTPAKSLLDYARSRTQTQQNDNAAFGYRTLLTNVLAQVLERAARQPVRQLFEDRLWRKIGCEQDCAIVVDPTGFPYFGAGMNVCARDLARFGQLLLDDGRCNDRQVVPSAWISDTLSGSDHLRTLFAAYRGSKNLPGGHYSNQLWANRDAGTMFCIGIHGQFILTDKRTGAVIVKLSSHPKPSDATFFADSFSAMLALSEALA